VIDENSALVRFKLEILRKAMPARDAIVFGDIYGVDGAYTEKCIEYGCERALLIDSNETPAWSRARLSQPSIDFYKGDFSDTMFMASVRETYEIGVAFDILLHQAPLLHTLHLMLEKVTGRFLIVQPMLEEQSLPNSVVFLPGNTAAHLHPFSERADEYRLFDDTQVNRSHWLWGLTPSFLKAALAGEGFRVVHEAVAEPLLPNPHWSWQGFIAERQSQNLAHWSEHKKSLGLREPGA